MNTSLRPAAIALMLCAAWACASAQTDKANDSKPAETPKPIDSGKAAERCEDAVAETIKNIRGRDAHEVQFVGAKRTLSPRGGDETGVKGEGRYRGAAGGSVSFTYTCAFNAQTGATSGVLFRETGGTRASVSAEQAWQPDLTKVSPEACETATAAALKDKYPRVGRIAFGSDTRQLRPAPNAHISLEGQGAVQPAPGMNSSPFKYRCEFEGRSGKLVSVQTSP